MNQANWFMALLVWGVWSFTMASFLGAIRALRVIKREGVNGDMSAYMRQCIRHEGIRVIKHSIIVVLVLMSVLAPKEWWDAHNSVFFRNIGIVIVGVLIGLNSVWDTHARKRRMEAFELSKRLRQ